MAVAELSAAAFAIPGRVMDLNLSADNTQFLNDQVATGVFPTPDAAVDAAIILLRRDAEIREKVRRGCEQIERGEFVELDDQGLERYFQELFDVAGSDRESN